MKSAEYYLTQAIQVREEAATMRPGVRDTYRAIEQRYRSLAEQAAQMERAQTRRAARA